MEKATMPTDGTEANSAPSMPGDNKALFRELAEGYWATANQTFTMNWEQLGDIVNRIRSGDVEGAALAIEALTDAPTPQVKNSGL